MWIFERAKYIQTAIVTPVDQRGRSVSLILKLATRERQNNHYLTFDKHSNHTKTIKIKKKKKGTTLFSQ